jgi:hypothetical protein
MFWLTGLRPSSRAAAAYFVRNTVRRVLDAAGTLRKRFGDGNVTVAHSCFIDVDRAAKDADLLNRFGPPGKADGRPVGPHIVVASQVAEQSLDVDFDLLVTDLCPVDLLLQRMGRLHRHLWGGEEQTDRPVRLRKARCLVTGVDWAEEVPEPVRGSVAVYGKYALLRGAAALLPHLDGGPRRPVRLPVVADTRGLRFEGGDRPAWRREPCGPGGAERTPMGVRDLYTWQTRRLWLHFDAEGVHGVVLGYGDTLTSRNKHTVEPMTAWRRSKARRRSMASLLCICLASMILSVPRGAGSPRWSPTGPRVPRARMPPRTYGRGSLNGSPGW